MSRIRFSGQILGIFFVAFYSTCSILGQHSPPSPVAPQDSLKYLELEEGYEIQLVASEPQIVDPVTMQIDEKGRLWVVEMRDYPSESQVPKSRLVILEDRDRDGFAETLNVFADGLPFATGVQPWMDGALVTLEGELVFLRDTNSDGKADLSETWLTGFSTGNSQLRANHPTITSDGWLTIASGLRGGTIVGHPSTHFKDKTVELAASDVRVHLIRPELESITGTTQFGLAFDEVGRRYGCSNRQPCFEIVVDRDEANLTPLAGFAQPWQNALPSEAESKVFPLVNAWTTSNLHAGQFTAACGLCVSKSRIFPDADGLTVLTCEPTGSLVQRQTMVRENGLARIKPRLETKWREWVASRDPWFRPVDIYEGPQGAIYIVDMYRAVIEHPEWVPAELKNRPDQRLGDAHGRIYKVTRKGLPNHDPTNFGRFGSFDELLGTLLDSDTWAQRQASRLILQILTSQTDNSRYGQTIRCGLAKSLATQNVSGTAHCLGLLCAAGQISADDIVASLNNPVRDIRLAALRLAKSIKPSDEDWNAILPALIKSISQSDVEESRTAAWLIGSWPKPTAATLDLVNDAIQKRLAVGPSDDRYWWMAVAAATRMTPELLPLSVVLESDGAKQQTYNTTTMEAVERLLRFSLANSTVGEQTQTLLASIERVFCKESFRQSSAVAYHLAALVGLSGQPIGTPEQRKKLSWGIRQFLKSTADSHLKLAGTRALSSILSDDDSESVTFLMEQLGSDQAEIVQTTIASLSKFNLEDFSKWLIDSFDNLPQTTRSIAFQAILANNDRTSRFLESIEANKVPMKILDPSQMQSLGKLKDESLQKRAAKLLAATVNPDRENLVQRYQSSISGLEVGKDPTLGKELFRKHCASCHKLDNIGVVVGPDISDSREQTYAKLLISILDPNRGIDANYFRYLALTEDGETVEGLLRDSNAQTVTLEGQNGVKRVLNRSELEEFKSSGVSMMPEGFENQMNPEELAELLWFIKNWRYVADKIPAVAKIP